MPNPQSSLKIVEAKRSKLIQKTGFKGYDVCLNTYVGCQFGCKYCYVRFFIKDDEVDWGEFVRLRSFIHDKLPRELPNFVGDRLVLGTMTDPYQPLERKHRLTRQALTAIIDMEQPLRKVGIFTRSPIVADDIDLIAQLPRKRVHYTVTPYSQEMLTKIEPIAISIPRRFETIATLKAAGIRVHVNVAPALPILSDKYTTEYAQRLAELKVDEFFVDPMQPYAESWLAIDEAMQGNKSWAETKQIVNDREAFAEWKNIYQLAWERAWRKVQHLSPHTLPIWSDHVHHTWIDMRTGQHMDPKAYGDDLNN